MSLFFITALEKDGFDSQPPLWKAFVAEVKEKDTNKNGKNDLNLDVHPSHLGMIIEFILLRILATLPMFQINIYPYP